MTTKQTVVGRIDPRVLRFTAGRDTVLDLALAEVDCIGTAAHVTMLSRMREVDLFSETDRERVIAALVDIIRQSRQGRFCIRSEDQDVHLAVERMLTASLGDLGRRVHTARSRNDQVAVDLRLYAKGALLRMMTHALALAKEFLRMARRHAAVPMVGRTHLQPAMPSSVGVWASAHAEALLDDVDLLRAAFAFNDRCPLGAAAGYGVPLPIDRKLTARLLGFAGPVRNVLYAGNARGKGESVVLSAAAQVMLTLSRAAEDLILYSMPEFGYFAFPPEFGTGSSIMPQKNNPDVLELVRAKCSRVQADAAAVASIVAALPSGYNRDLQETKEPFLQGVAATETSLEVMVPLVDGLRVGREALKRAFSPGVFATDEALQKVAAGVPFRRAYDEVKQNLPALAAVDPDVAAGARFGEGGPADPGLSELRDAAREARRWVRASERRFHRAVTKLLGCAYPSLDGE